MFLSSFQSAMDKTFLLISTISFSYSGSSDYCSSLFLGSFSLSLSACNFICFALVILVEELRVNQRKFFITHITVGTHMKFMRLVKVDTNVPYFLYRIFIYSNPILIKLIKLIKLRNV